MPIKKNTHRLRNRKLPVILLTAVVVLSGTLLALELTGTTDFWRSVGPRKQAPTIGPATKGETPNADTGDTANIPETGTTNDTASETPKTPGSSGSATLLAPSGNFVSNHTPNLAGKPSPNLIQSTCVTTPGASCTIIFTKNGVTKMLPIQTTDLEGAAYWEWKLQDYGITEGEWTVQAKATLGSQTQTTNDSLMMKVLP